jgi:molybdopterin molybdotransferase
MSGCPIPGARGPDPFVAPSPDLREAPVVLDAALARILADVLPRAETEPVELAAALGRILREEVVSPIDVPGADNSAVDGYAVHADDLAPAGATRLPVVGRAAAGHPFAGPVPRGAALRIFTGAPMPPGADMVVMQEDCRIEGEEVLLPAGLKRGSNRRRAGEDVRAGATVLAAGLRLRPQEIGLAAAIGRRRLTVARALRVALVSVGDESDMGYSNREGLGALLRQLGLHVADRGPLPGSRAEAEGALRAAAAENDVILASGDIFLDEAGSFGAAVAALGRLRLWHLALKPGRTVAIGALDRPRPAIVIGLSGNPVAAIVGFVCLARPILLHLLGARELFPRRYRMSAGFEHRKKPGRREFLRARRIAEAEVAALPYPAQGSGIPSTLIAADGLVELPEALTRVERGSMVEFLPFGEVG